MTSGSSESSESSESVGSAYRPWRVAWQDALYGEGGFYRRAEGPAGHFETSANAPGGEVALLAEALLELARRHGCRRVVDLAAGRGELAAALASCASRAIGLDPDDATGEGVEVVAVDVVDRPTGFPGEVQWWASPGGVALPDELADLDRTLVFAHEWLDVVPCDVLEVDAEGRLRLVEVADDGRERLGAPADDRDVEWAARWWPAGPPGSRVEVGRTRDDALVDLVRRVVSGVVVAVDYGHRADRRPAAGTLTGYAEGRQVPPRPDRSMDLTAHVAWDSAVEALAAFGAPEHTSLSSQAEVLSELGVSAARPPLDEARGAGAMSYLTRLTRASAAGTLLDPAGRGGLGWLAHAKVGG